MSLVNIYETVFYDPRQLVSILPDSVASQCSAGRQWDMRLGDLPLTNDVCMRILNAVKLMLDPLNVIEITLVCRFFFFYAPYITNWFLEHVQCSNDNIMKSLFHENVGPIAAMEEDRSGVRTKVDELQVVLKQNFNVWRNNLGIFIHRCRKLGI